VIVRAWRIFKPKHARSAFTGDGARLYGGRWNSRGVPMIYVAGSQSLAALEMLVHLSSAEIMAKYRVCPVEFETTLVEQLDIATLPAKWRSDPPPQSLKAIGDKWILEARSAILCVPSAVVPDEFNYLINPTHRHFKKLVVGKHLPFKFDPRLIK
jgi:RES domain-containing protein